MFARFAGIGMGHDAVNLGQVPALGIMEDNEVDVKEVCGESKEPNTPDENREHSDSEGSDDENDSNTEEDFNLENVSNNLEVDEDNSYY